MHNLQKPAQSTGKKPGQTEELKTEGPLSEKDEVKAAELNTAKTLKKIAKDKKE